METRYLTVANLEVRQLGDGQREFRGYAIKFDEWSSDLGGFVERCDPDCVTRALAAGQDVRHLINHDPNLVLGRTSSGTTRLERDSVGLAVVTDLPDTSYARDMAVSIERGDVSQMSFGFTVAKDEWDWEATPAQRTLLDVDLFDVSTVTFPAYPQTTAEIRSHLPSEVREVIEERAGKAISSDNAEHVKSAASAIADAAEHIGALADAADLSAETPAEDVIENNAVPEDWTHRVLTITNAYD
jgi:HK97 family phage prohead protease